MTHNIPYSFLYVHVAPGNPVPFQMFSGHGREDYLTLDDGETIMVFRARNGEPRRAFEKLPGVTVLPLLHRPVKAHHVTAFQRLGVQIAVGDEAYDVAERIYEKFGMAWMDPEKFDI